MSITIGTAPLPVPPPEPGFRVRGETAYPFEQLPVGGWFKVHGRAPSTVRCAVLRYYRNNGKDRRFVQRTGADGEQIVWRTA